MADDHQEMDKRFIGYFKNDYRIHGKFNLEIQVPHLARLAEFYREKYSNSEDWTHCLKFEGWKRQAFEVQQDYWGEHALISIDQQRDLTASLKNELKSIRDNKRQEMLKATEAATGFASGNIADTIYSNFNEQVKFISLNCSEEMAAFAGRVISESVAILKNKVPCDFAAVAIGSLARGEATPYSDLEYLFLVEMKTPETVAYFERLAMTTYFLIGNLGETKLSYMAIKELKGWFDDKSTNGFKIDGLSAGAGNIPTGNGSAAKYNHFIVTPQELTERYQSVLDNPDEKEALRGDLTAMLTYMKQIYCHQKNGKNLLQELRDAIGKMTLNEERQNMNLKMMCADVNKFDFKPDNLLSGKGFNVDVKRELYRFPSIILLDISIVTKTTGQSSWDVLDALNTKNVVSEYVCSVLKFLLAAAAYIRLSAYLHHDAQDDRMSVTQKLSGSEAPQLSKSGSRWFIPSGLFNLVCDKMVPLKKKLAESVKKVTDLKTVSKEDEQGWSRIATLYYTGRYGEARLALKQIYGDKLCDDPLYVAQHLPPGQSEADTLDIISNTLHERGEYRPALVLCQHMIDSNIEIKPLKRLGSCYGLLGDNNKAVEILQSITMKSVHVYCNLGQAYIRLRQYKKAEQSVLQALEISYNATSAEQLYDYYGNPVKADESQDTTSQGRFIDDLSPEKRLSMIVNGSPSVLVCVSLLGHIYNNQAQYISAAAYYKKSLQLMPEVYGEGAAVEYAADTLTNLGITYRRLGQTNDADECYKRALAMYRELSHGTETLKIGRVLNNIANNYNTMGLYDEAEKYCKESIAVQRGLKLGDNVEIGETLDTLGFIYHAAGEKKKAIDALIEAKEIFLRVDPAYPQIDVISSFLESLSLSDQTEDSVRASSSATSSEPPSKKGKTSS